MKLAKADAAVDALAAQPFLLRAQARVVDHLDQLVERGDVREPLELHAGGRGARVGAVGHQIAAAELHRVEAGSFCGEVHQALGDGRGDGVADGAVLAGRRLVLQHHRGLGAVVGEVVGAADQVHHLVAFHRAGARIDRIGADAGQVVDVDGGDAALGVYAHAALDAVVAGVDVGGEALQPVGDELHRPRHDFCDDRGGDLVRVDVHLDAVAAADVGADHAHVALGHAHLLGEYALHHVRCLGGVVDGELARGAVVVGQDRARLERGAGVAAGVEGGFHDLVRGGERLVHLAALVDALEAQVVAEIGMDDRRIGSERGLHIHRCRQRLVGDIDLGDRILGNGARLRHHGGNGLADPGCALDGERPLRRGLHALEVRQHRHPGLAMRLEIAAREDAHDARHLECRRRVDAGDPGVRDAGSSRRPRAPCAAARCHRRTGRGPPPASWCWGAAATCRCRSSAGRRSGDR